MKEGEMGREIQELVKIWVIVIISLCYCYSIIKPLESTKKRLLLLLPVFFLFLYLPLNVTSPHLGGTTAFFVSWLANFKLLLFAFHKGPLASSSHSLPLFIAVSCFPIKLQQNPPPQHSDEAPGPLNYTIKILLLALLVRVYDYIELIHPKLLLVLYSFHVYFMLELILAVFANLARNLLGLELEPQFNKPYIATSLQDFWGRRWNLMVTSILRPVVYEPVARLASGRLGRNWASLPAVFATFVVSGLMHELMFFYLGERGHREFPTWENTRFFLLHGACLVLEIGAKKLARGRWGLPRVVSGAATVGFVMATGFWMFFPQFVRLRIDVRAFEDYAAVRAWFGDVCRRALVGAIN